MSINFLRVNNLKFLMYTIDNIYRAEKYAFSAINLDGLKILAFVQICHFWSEKYHFVHT